MSPHLGRVQLRDDLIWSQTFFSTFRIWQGQICDFAAHVERICRGSGQQIPAEVFEQLSREIQTSALEHQIARGRVWFHPTEATWAWDFQPWQLETLLHQRRNGISVGYCQTEVLEIGVHNGSKAPGYQSRMDILAQTQYDEYLLGSSERTLGELCTGSLLAWIQGHWVLHSPKSKVQSLTIQRWQKLGLQISFSELTLKELQNSTALYVVSSLRGFVPIVQLLDQTWKSADWSESSRQLHEIEMRSYPEFLVDL